MFKTAKVDLKGPLKPGVYSAARRISASKGSLRTPFGVHRFLILIPREPEKFQGKLTDLGNGQKGIIVGALNVSTGLFQPRLLKYHRNNENDVAAARELLKHKQEGKGHYQTSIKRVVRSSKSYTDKEIDEILQKAKAYRRNTQDNPVKYPGLFENIFNRGTNSNTFVASLLEHTGHGQKEKKMDIPGYDPGSQLRFDKELFTIPKTAADVLYMHKEALSMDELKEAFKNTDPRWWTTPTGTVLGLTLMHALGDPGKRSRMRYLLAGLAGTAGGWGAGEALKTHMPAFNQELNRVLAGGADKTEDSSVPGTPETKAPTKLNLDENMSFDEFKDNLGAYIAANPETLTKDIDTEEWDRVYEFVKKKYPEQFHKPGMLAAIKRNLWGEKAIRRMTEGSLVNIGGGLSEDLDEMYGKQRRALAKANWAKDVLRSQGRLKPDIRKRLLPYVEKAVAYGSDAGMEDPESPTYGLDADYHKNVAKGVLTGGFLTGPLRTAINAAHNIFTPAGEDWE